MTRIHRDDQIYKALVREHAGALYRFAHRLCGETELAEDLVQETYLEAWRSIGSLKDAGRGKAWLFRILRRRFARTLQSRQNDVTTTENVDQIENAAAPSRDILDLLADQELLRQAIDGLDPRFREPFLLAFGDGLTCQEVADVMEIPLGTVLSRICRARAILRARLRQLESRILRRTDITTGETVEE